MAALGVRQATKTQVRGTDALRAVAAAAPASLVMRAGRAHRATLRR